MQKIILVLCCALVTLTTKAQLVTPSTSKDIVVSDLKNTPELGDFVREKEKRRRAEVVPIKAVTVYSPILMGMIPITLLPVGSKNILIVSKSMTIDDSLAMCLGYRRLDAAEEKKLIESNRLLIENWLNKNRAMRDFVKPIGIIKE